MKNIENKKQIPSNLKFVIIFKVLILIRIINIKK
jgi:hypothetical protein